MNRLGLPALVAALAACIPCVLLPILAATGAGAAVAALGSWLGIAFAILLATLGSGAILGVVLLLRRRSCEVAQ
jgi:hypothetical protein